MESHVPSAQSARQLGRIKTCSQSPKILIPPKIMVFLQLLDLLGGYGSEQELQV